DHAVCIHVAGSQRHGGRYIDGTGGAVHTVHGDGNIGAIAGGSVQVHRYVQALLGGAGDRAAGRGGGARYTCHRFREGENDGVHERVTCSLAAFHPRSSGKWHVNI